MRVLGGGAAAQLGQLVLPAAAKAWAAASLGQVFGHPITVSLGSVAVFLVVRLVFGGAAYLPSAAWYFLCFVIPAYVALAVLLSDVTIPLTADWQTGLHCALVLVYCQLDLLCAQVYTGDRTSSWSVFGLVAPKLGLFPRPLGKGDAGLPPVSRTVFELNGATLHEIFWNVLVCQNWIDYGIPAWAAVCCVPLLSGVVHGIVSNARQGLLLVPQYFWVALAYHASGSVAPPALIHTLWYLLDGKLLFLLQTMRRDWDAEARVEERQTPLPGPAWAAGFALMLGFYLLLNAAAHHWPRLVSEHPHVRGRPQLWPEYFFVGATAVQLVLGYVLWRPARAMMEKMEGGDMTAAGQVEAEVAMREEVRKLPSLVRAALMVDLEEPKGEP